MPGDIALFLYKMFRVGATLEVAQISQCRTRDAGDLKGRPYAVLRKVGDR